MEKCGNDAGGRKEGKKQAVCTRSKEDKVICSFQLETLGATKGVEAR